MIICIHKGDRKTTAKIAHKITDDSIFSFVLGMASLIKSDPTFKARIKDEGIKNLTRYLKKNTIN